jgi:GNAT superfamily N-acetyltransferase
VTRKEAALDATQDEPTMAEREERAQHALHAYRERRRRRRGEDTWFGSAEFLLSAEDAALDLEEVHRRRMDVVDEAQREGMSPELAEMMYDVAREEGLDPALAYEVVRSGLGVAPPPDGVANAAQQPSSDKYYPTWLLPATSPDDVLRERMLRMSFRRLRSLLERHADAAEAFRAYAHEPDVGVYGF